MKTYCPRRIVGFILGLALAGTRHCAWGNPSNPPPTNAPCAPVVSVNGLSAGSFSFNITGAATGPRYVWSTSDLTTPLWNWDFQGTVTLNGSPQVFTDNSVSNVMYRFYKVATTNGDCCSLAIGFIRVDVGPGTTSWPGPQALIANQLYAPANTLDGLFNPMPDGNYLPAGSTIKKWDPSGLFVIYQWDGSSWGGNGGVSLNPGEGAFLVHPLTNNFRVSFAGLVQDGTQTLTLPGGAYHLVSSTVPKAGGLQSALGYVPNRRDIVSTWISGSSGYSSYVYGAGGWAPGEPSIRVGEGLFIQGRTNNAWQTTFSGCPFLSQF